MSNWNDKPLFRLALAACPALAVATTAVNGLVMGIATGCVLVLAGIVAAALGGFVSEKGRAALFMIASAVFAGIAWMVVRAAWTDAAALGVYLPLIAVNSLLLARPEGENGVGQAVAEGVKLALGFICLVTVLGAVRELVDAGTLFGARILPKGTQLSALAALPAGGLMLLGLFTGIANAIRGRGARKEDEAA